MRAEHICGPWAPDSTSVVSTWGTAVREVCVHGRDRWRRLLGALRDGRGPVTCVPVTTVRDPVVAGLAPAPAPCQYCVASTAGQCIRHGGLPLAVRHRLRERDRTRKRRERASA